MRDPHTRESRGFGFVKMVTSEQADAAKSGLQGEVYEGRTLSIEKARRARPRTPTPGKYFGPPKRGQSTPTPSISILMLTTNKRTVAAADANTAVDTAVEEETTTDAVTTVATNAVTSAVVVDTAAETTTVATTEWTEAVIASTAAVAVVAETATTTLLVVTIATPAAKRDVAVVELITPASTVQPVVPLNLVLDTLLQPMLLLATLALAAATPRTGMSVVEHD